jgi:hypothetical protein
MSHASHQVVRLSYNQAHATALDTKRSPTSYRSVTRSIPRVSGDARVTAYERRNQCVDIVSNQHKSLTTSFHVNKVVMRSSARTFKDSVTHATRPSVEGR